MYSSRSIAVCALVLLVYATGAKAALVLESNFNGMSGSQVTGITGGTASLYSSSGTPTIIESTPTLGQDGYLRVSCPAGQKAGVNITPTDASHSIASWYTAGDGVSTQSKFNGGLDFFFRAAESSLNQKRIFDIQNTGGYRIVMQSASSSELYFEMIGQTGAFSGMTKLKGSGTANTAGSLSSFNITSGNTGNFLMAANEIYHIAVHLETDDSGLVHLKLLAAPGTGALDPTDNSQILTHATFQINEATATTGFKSGVFTYGIVGTVSTNARTQDFDAFRIYDSGPTLFGAVPEPTVMLLLGSGLVAIIRRRG